MKTEKMYASEVSGGYDDDLDDVIEYYFKVMNPNDGHIFTIKHANYITHDASFYFNISDFLEALEEKYDIKHAPDDDWFIALTSDHKRDLNEAVSNVIDKWAAKHYLQPNIGIITNPVGIKYRVTCDGYELVSKV